MGAGLRGYVLAGGRSSRMGVDKAELRVGGRSLLEVAIGTLRSFCAEVVVVGEREAVPAGVRVIADVHRGCGPLGGIEAGLRDAGEAAAVFLPVDMPFVPAELLRRMVARWESSGCAVCFAVVDGRTQPLVSLMRPSVLPEVEAALRRGEYKVGRVLEGAAGEALRTEIATTAREGVWPVWVPGDAEWAERELWFANLNTPEEFAAAGRWRGEWENGTSEDA